MRTLAALAAGAIWVPATLQAGPVIANGVRDLGIDPYAASAKPGGTAMPLKPVRIGRVDRYGGVIPAGWTKWILEQFKFPYTVVYPQELDAGGLGAEYDVLLFADGTVPPNGDGAYRGRMPFLPKPGDPGRISSVARHDHRCDHGPADRRSRQGGRNRHRRRQRGRLDLR